MGKIVVSENISLDGVIQNERGWFEGFSGTDYDEWAKIETAEALGAAALLLGRRSDEWFGARWTSRTGVWWDRLNSMPKYVVSSTIEHPVLANSTVLSGDLADQVSKLKGELAGEIVVYASVRLVHTLLDEDLVDELRLTVHPVVLGTGARLFGETRAKKTMRLRAARAVGDGLAYLSYEFVREPGS